jgi:hypothetical protein
VHLDGVGEGGVLKARTVPRYLQGWRWFPVANPFWLYRWFDEYDVKSTADLDALFVPDTAAARRLWELTAEEPWHPLAPFAGAEPAIVAGRGIDLSGELDCHHHECQIRQADRLFARVLLYFDEIVVAGPQAHTFVDDLKEGHDESALLSLKEHAISLLYLRSAGVEDMLRFVQKPAACALHYKQHAEEAGILEVVERADALVEDLRDRGTIRDVEPHDDHWHYRFDHPGIEHTNWGAIATKAGGAPTDRDVAEAVLAQYVAHLVSDLSAAQQLRLPLGAEVAIHSSTLEQRPVAPAIDDVAFSLQLPVLEEVPVSEIVRIRNDELESFYNLRNALTLAIQERISSGFDSNEIAESIAQDVIAPELARIAARLSVAQRTLSRKSTASVGLGTLVTVVGLLVGVPIVAGAGLAAIGTSLPAIHKYFDDKGAVELSDMYFLWKLQEAAQTHRH